MMTPEELKEKLTGIEHYIVPGQEYWLYEQVFKLPGGSNILEIGCYQGYSAAAMALACRVGEKRILTIDSNLEFISRAVQNWIRMGVSEIIAARCVDSEAVVSAAERTFGERSVDFAFIDGNHIAPFPEKDFRNVLKVMRHGGRIVLHDVIETWPDVQKVWNEIAGPMLKNHEFCHSIASGQVPEYTA